MTHCFNFKSFFPALFIISLLLSSKRNLPTFKATVALPSR